METEKNNVRVSTRNSLRRHKPIREKYMKNKRSIFWATVISAILIAGAFTSSAYSQPTAAQLKAIEPKKDIVSFTWHKPGTREWSSTYKKYVYSIYWTAKRKTDQPGVTLTVKGYSSFDIIGGKYVYWRDLVSTNSYDGQAPPPIADINKVLALTPASDYTQHLQVGEFENLRLAPKPDWEWHTMNSVSFTVIGVYRIRNSGVAYSRDEPYYNSPAGKQAVDRIESHLRIRLYRDSPTLPWRAVAISDRVPGDEARKTLITVRKLLDPQLVDFLAARELPGPTRPPVLTQ